MSTEALSNSDKLHFTYVAPPSSENLEQGDVLEKNDEIKELISEVHLRDVDSFGIYKAKQ